MPLPLFRALPLAAFLIPALPAVASRFAVGMQIESWKNANVELSENPGNKSNDKIGFSGLEFEVGPMTNWYLEEPGFLFSLISGAAGSEANEVNARNEAARKGESVYRWSYAQPAPIPEGRWFRWGYSHAFASGGTRTVRKPALSNGKDTTFVVKDPKLRFDYQRFDMNLVTAPRMIGKSDFYWMLGSDISGTSVKIYGGTSDGTTGISGGYRPGDDWSFMSTPLNLHLGWNPMFFPYLMVEANGGLDFIDPIGNLFTGFKNYTPYSKFGLRANLGTDWLGIYYDLSHQVDPLYDYGEYNRRYAGFWSVFGARLDIGNLFAKLF